MSTITPPPNVSPSQTGNVASLNIKVVDPPPQIKSLQVNTVVRAKVTGLNSDGTITLSGDGTVDNAVFDVKTNLALPLKTNLSLKITKANQDGSLSLKVIAVEGKSPAKVFSADGKIISSELLELKNKNSSAIENNKSFSENKSISTRNVVFGKSAPFEAVVLRAGKQSQANLEAIKNIENSSWFDKVLGTSNKNTNIELPLPTGTSIKARITSFTLPKEPSNIVTNQKNDTDTSTAQATFSNNTKATQAEKSTAQTQNNINASQTYGKNQRQSANNLASFNTSNQIQDGLKKQQANFANQIQAESQNKESVVSQNFGLHERTANQQAKTNISPKLVPSANEPPIPSKSQLEHFKSLSGVVLDEKIQGKTVIKTSSGVIAIPTKTPLPPDTKVMLDIIDVVSPTSTKEAQPQAKAFFEGGKGWPSFDMLAQELNSKGQEKLLSNIINKIPRPNTNLASNLISYVNAVQKGDVVAWLGEKNITSLKSLSSKGLKISRTLDKEIKEISKKSKSQSKNWSSIDIPFVSNNSVQKITAIFRRFDDQDFEGDTNRIAGKFGGGIRFIINLDLSNLGAMQLDGLSFNQERRFDLIIRTKKLLPGNIPLDIQSIYKSSLSSLDYVGNISFSVLEEFPDVLRTKHKKNKGSGIVV